MPVTALLAPCVKPLRSTSSMVPTVLMPGVAALMSAEALFTNSVYLRASDALQQKKEARGGEVENEKGK